MYTECLDAVRYISTVLVRKSLASVTEVVDSVRLTEEVSADRCTERSSTLSIAYNNHYIIYKVQNLVPREYSKRKCTYAHAHTHTHTHTHAHTHPHTHTQI